MNSILKALFEQNSLLWNGKDEKKKQTLKTPDHPEITRVLELSEATRRSLYDWDPDPFHSRSYGLTWRPKTEHLIIQEAGHPASHVGLIRETILVDNTSLQVGGIGDVITIPEFCGQGLAQAGITRALEIVWTEWRLAYALLFCFSPLRSFYERLGWKVIEEPVWIQQPNGKLRMPVFSMFASRDGDPWPSGPVEINGLPW